MFIQTGTRYKWDRIAGYSIHAEWTLTWNVCTWCWSRGRCRWGRYRRRRTRSSRGRGWWRSPEEPPLRWWSQAVGVRLKNIKQEFSRYSTGDHPGNHHLDDGVRRRVSVWKHKTKGKFSRCRTTDHLGENPYIYTEIKRWMAIARKSIPKFSPPVSAKSFWFFWLQQVGISSPPVPTPQPTVIEWQMVFKGPRHLPKCWGKKPKATTKVTLRATNKGKTDVV